MTTTTEELKGVRNNLNAIRIEQQTAGRRRVAFPVEPYGGASQFDFREDIETDIDDARRTEEEDIRTATDASTGYSAAEAIAAKMRKQIKKLGKQPTSAFDPIIDTTEAETEAEAAAEEAAAAARAASVLLPPRGRRGRGQSNKKSASDLKKELKQEGVKVPSSFNAAQIRKLAEDSGVSLLR